MLDGAGKRSCQCRALRRAMREYARCQCDRCIVGEMWQRMVKREQGTPEARTERSARGIDIEAGAHRSLAANPIAGCIDEMIDRSHQGEKALDRCGVGQIDRGAGGTAAKAGDRGTDLLGVAGPDLDVRSEEHTSELQSLMRISYYVFCL